MFDFTYQISGLNNIDRRMITVNGKSLLEINQQSIFSEIDINYDSIGDNRHPKSRRGPHFFLKTDP